MSDEEAMKEAINLFGKQAQAEVKKVPTSRSISLQEAFSEIKIELSQSCDNQSAAQANEAHLPGNNFNFQVPKPKPNEIRIAFAGDSVTQGFGGMNMQ
jgi:hypothetical protein